MRQAKEKEYDYPRWAHEIRQHHARYSSYVDAHGITCQECGGSGGEIIPVLDYGQGPWENCGWCEGTGLVTRWLRGQWLRYKRSEKKI